VATEGGPATYEDARLLDALRLHPTTTRLVPEDETDWATGVNSFTLPPSFRHAVNSMSFFSDIAEVRSPIASLLSKVLNSRCQARKYGTVAEKCLIENDAQRRRFDTLTRSKEWTDDPAKRPAALLASVANYHAIGAMRLEFKTVVLCSLLGNYPHCTTRLYGEARPMAYRLLLETDWFFQSLLHQCPFLVVWCLRDYLVHTLLDNSGLREQVRELMHFDRFTDLVQQAMVVARAFVMRDLPHAWSELGAAARANDELLCRCMFNRRNGQPRSVAPPCAHAQDERHGSWLRDLSAALFPFHEPMLAISYRKPDTSEISLLLSVEVRKASAAPLVPRPLAPGERLDAGGGEGDGADLDSSGDDDDDDDDDGAALVRRLGLATQEAARASQRKAAAAARKAESELTRSPHVYLTPTQFDCLGYLVDTASTGRLTDLVDAIAANGFGMSTDTATFIRKLLHAHRDGTVTRNERIKAIIALQRRDPHSYNLLQVGAELMRDKETRRAGVVGVMPAEALQAQVAACERRWGTPGAIEHSAASLHYCSICGTVYSNVHDAHAPHAKFYRYGLYNAVRDYTTGQVYCKRAKANHRGACRDTPLSSVCLLGVRYSFERKVYQLCVGCGDIMVPDTRSCHHDSASGGMLCCECSYVAKVDETKTDTTARFLEGLDRTCVCCNKRAVSPYLYPHGIVICHRHHSRFMMRKVSEAAPVSAEACREMAIAIHTHWRERCRQRAKPGDNKRMKARRQRDRGKRA
jgi:hypothetical protein